MFQLNKRRQDIDVELSADPDTIMFITKIIMSY
mgnify:CR=1 FL=1